MIKRLALTALFSVSACGIASADVDRTVKYRQAVFTIVGWNFGPLRAMAQGKMEFDASAAQTHAERIHQASKMIDVAFPPDSINRSSDALPAIWENWADFEEKAANFQTAAGALVDAAATGDKDATIGAFAKVGGTCKACHDSYKD